MNEGSLLGSGWTGALFRRSLGPIGAVLGVARPFPKRGCRGARLGEPEEDVLTDAPSSIDVVSVGSGGTVSEGAKRPFFVGVDLGPTEKRPLALGADATRRRNREAEAPTAFGVRGRFRDRDGGGGPLNEAWDGVVPGNRDSSPLVKGSDFCLLDGLCARIVEIGRAHV